MNNRFREYATSGAFCLNLSRNQIAELAIRADEPGRYTSGSVTALERKGLLVPLKVPTLSDTEAIEFRPTHAGLLCLTLLREAGLVNTGNDFVAEEIAKLQRELEQARMEARECKARAWSAIARKEVVEHQNTRLRSQIETMQAGVMEQHEDNDRPMIALKDIRPDLSDAELKGEKP